MTDALTTAKQLGAGEFDATLEVAIAEGYVEGVRVERERIRAIMTCPEAAGREAAAGQLAISCCVSLEQAREILALSQPKLPVDSVVQSQLYH